MENFTSLFPVTTESGDYYDLSGTRSNMACPSYDYNIESVVTCASNEVIYAPPPPTYEQTPTSSSMPWLLAEMTAVQNSILPQEDVEPQIELATLDFDINLLQGPSSQNMDFSITGTINYEDISHPNYPQNDPSSVPPSTYLRRSPRLARKKKMAENILQLPTDYLFLEEVTPISTTCLTPDKMHIPSTSTPIKSSLLELMSNNPLYYGGDCVTTTAPYTMYSSPTHITTSPSNTSPQQIYHHSSGLVSPSNTSPQQIYYNSSGSNTPTQHQQCSPLPNFSTIKPPPSYPGPRVETMSSQRQTTDNISPIFSSTETLDDNIHVYLPSTSTASSTFTNYSTSIPINDPIISEPSIQMQSTSYEKIMDEEIFSRRTRTKRLPPSYSTVERMLPQRQNTDISPIFSSAEILDDNAHTYLPSTSAITSVFTNSSSPTPIIDQNISNASIQLQSSSRLSKKRDEERAVKRTRTKRLPRATYEAMSENERSQHNKTLSQQRCVRYRDNKRQTVKQMEKTIDHLEEKRKQLQAKFEALKLTKLKVEQLMPAFLRNC